jgi:hypothetical protein
MHVQMSFGGHHAKKASDQLQKKLQEAMGDGADNLADNLAGMDVKDDMSIASSNAETELELLRAQVRHLQGQNNVMAMTITTLTQQLAETSAAVSLEQQKHNRIISNPVFVSALSAMQGPDLDIDTLWWMVQWGNEYLARFKRDATTTRKRTPVIRNGQRIPGRSCWLGFLRACALRLVMIPSISPRMIRYSC